MSKLHYQYDYIVVGDIARQPALRPFLKAEIAPGSAIESDAALDDYIRKTAVTAHHALGTCRMGTPEDPLAVVDASVMPDLVGGNINAAVIMIAEKAADLIRGRRPLPAARRETKRACEPMPLL